jgi:two-component system OmpR family response regulator
VLLVEDDPRFADVVRSMLEDDGYEVVAIAASGTVLPAAVAEHHPDIVVLDLVLPDGDGLQAADDLRRSGAEVPVVVFSSLFDQRIARETLDAGFGYVEKAAGLDALELAIEGIIDLRDQINPTGGS